MQYLKKIVKLAFDSGLIRRFSLGFYKMKKDKIYIIRGMRVMLDYDLAELYQVETKKMETGRTTET